MHKLGCTSLWDNAFGAGAAVLPEPCEAGREWWGPGNGWQGIPRAMHGRTTTQHKAFIGFVQLSRLEAAVTARAAALRDPRV